MKIELNFSLREKILPLDYRRIFISFIKKTLTECKDGKYYDYYFGRKKTKDYSFSVIMPGPVFNKKEIILNENNLKMIVSASDKNKTGYIFCAAFMNMKNKEFDLPLNNSMTLTKIRILKENIVDEEEILVQTSLGTGLCIREHSKATNKDRYLIYNDEAFVEQAEKTLQLQALDAGFSENKCKKIKIQPVLCKKNLIYHYGIYIDVSTGVFKLSGDPKVLEYFCQAGIGSRSSAGFGQINLIKQ